MKSVAKQKRMQVIGFVLAFVGMWLILQPAPAQAAITSRFPDADSVSLAGGNYDAYASVSEGGTYTDAFGTWSIGRDTPNVEFKLFYKLFGPGATPNATFNVSLRRACDFSADFVRGNPNMNVAVMRVDSATGALTSIVEQKDNISAANCAGTDMNFVINRSDLTIVPSRYGNDYGVIAIRASKLPGVGANSFQVESTDGIGLVSFNEQAPADVNTNANPGPSTSFAIWDNPNWTQPREYTFEFMPDCQYAATFTEVNLRWYDADMDQIDPGINFTLEILNIIDDSPAYPAITIDRNSAPTNIGDTGPPSYRYITVPIASQTQYYRWTWRSVTGLNGLQLWMPFSEMNQFIACPPAPSQLNCQVTVLSNPLPGADYNVRFRVTNNTGSSLSSANGYRLGANVATSGSGTDNYMAPDAANWVREDIDWGPGIIPDGDTREWITTFRAYQPALFGGEHNGGDPADYSALTLSPGATYQFDWRIIENDTTWLADACQEIVQVANIPLNVTCTVITSPVNPSAGQAVQIRATVRNEVGSGGTITNASNPLTISATNGVMAANAVAYDNDPLDPGESGTALRDVTAPNGMGSFTVNASIAMPSGPPVTCQSNVEVAKKPYIKLFGADVNAGGSFNNVANPCAVPGGYYDLSGATTTSIKAFARNDRLPSTYHGSSVEFAAFSMGEIIGDSNTSLNDEERGFFSASLRNRGAEGLYLTFANTAAPTRWSGTEWGGEFSAAPRCIEDYYQTTRLPTITNRGGNFLRLDTNGGTGIRDSGQYQAGGGGPMVVLQNNPAVPFTNRVTLYVDGDLFIDDNIQYGTDYSTAVPYLTLIARGNIYINSSVTNIDALLIAQPDATGTTGGRVYTCATRTGINVDLVTAANLNGVCDNRLTIHGAVIAQQVRFLRSNGTLNASAAPELSGTTTAAEIIEMTPEFYVGVPMFRPKTGSNNGAQTFHAIQALPPVF